MIEHNVPPGALETCQITGSPNLINVIDLGAQPLCDTLVSDPNEVEVHYPLALNYCPESGLAQLSHVVDGAHVYPPSYPYRSGISKPLREYQQAFADRVVQRFGTGFVVDVGSNDGTLLTGFARHGCRVLGIEPTDIARIARSENDIDTVQRFFDEECGFDIASQDGRAHIITMTNVFAHMATLGTVMRGLDALLDDQGVFITESHYLLDVLMKNQFDTIYHEHVRTYTLRSIQCLVEQYGMEVFNVERGDRYGGNIRAYIGRKGKWTVEPAVGALRQVEDRYLAEPERCFERFRAQVWRNRDEFMSLLYRAKCRGERVVGCSAPGRATTLMNYYGINNGVIPYTAELPTSLKLGKMVPGARVPIVNNEILAHDQPGYIILFSWHYAEVIAKRLRDEGVRSHLVQPLPFVEVR